MNDKLSKLFKESYIRPSEDLSSEIWRVIERRKSKKIIIESTFFGLSGVFSFVGLVAFVFILKNQFESSGFFDYASLLFSGSETIAYYWQEYLLSLAESLPVASMGTSIFLLLSSLVSIRKFVSNYGKYQLKV